MRIAYPLLLILGACAPEEKEAETEESTEETVEEQCEDVWYADDDADGCDNRGRHQKN